MKILLECENDIVINKIPENLTENFWIVDEYNKNLINVDIEENKYILKSNTDVKITSTLEKKDLSNITYSESAELVEYGIYFLYNLLDEKYYKIYVIPSYQTFENLVINSNDTKDIIIGSSKNADICISSNLFKDKDISLEFDQKSQLVILNNLNKDTNCFVNYQKTDCCYLSSGDIIIKNGIIIYFFGSLLMVSKFNNELLFNSLKLNKRIINENPTVDYSTLIDKNELVFDKDKYFQRPPRFKRKIETKQFNIDPPTQKEKEEEMPLIFTIAPMLTMGMMSLVTGMTSLQKVLDGTSTIKKEFSSLLMCGCMILTMVFFPLLQKFYTKLKKKKKERKRRRKYKKYIDMKHDEIFHEINFQKQVLIEENLPIDKVREDILTHSRTIWQRKTEHDDFLNIRLGIGTRKPDIDIKYPEEHFTLEEDDLKDIIEELVNESKDIEEVPITLNLKENNKTGIIGPENLIYNMLDNILLQTIAYQGYDMLRIVIITNNKNKVFWDKFRNLPYLWNNEKSSRYYATNKEDINKLTTALMEEYNFRIEMSGNEDMVFNPYYLIITDDIASVKTNTFITEVLKSKSNLGYSLLMCVDKLDLLPNECSMFVNLSNESSGIFTNDMTFENQLLFNRDIVNFSMKNCISEISNIPIDINNGKFALPKKYGFLEMYDVGNVKQLNITSRWKNNDIKNSLSCPVGIDEQGELFNIDLHEKAHGPHGLVAGTTGSGKSEWIITYILSMAVNYSPEEVQFVLIDYKGGGLALTFDNRENDIKLPHVVGTLTNLDVVEMKRSLASINSELKRRQAKFKEAREELRESSMDIYKYQQLYREGKLKEPMSHLFIISDEFAELKSQQPEFMEELISTARIGRSLGIHLILATQKPSGVVDDQIWSNSKFKVCLKVQDKNDSNDMLKCPDAAMIKETGRFYLQVGYNELFMLGQSAYAGCPYYESDKKIVMVDSTIDFVNELGSTIQKGDIEKKSSQFEHKGEELPNILNYIIETYKNVTMNVKSLWLSSIPKEIFVDKIKTKYNWEKERFVLCPVIGEYDNPSKQMQGILTLPISQDGNVLIYGTSGSGKENLITTITYSLIKDYSPDEVNIYILDFGTEVLNNFSTASQVGDIIHNGEDEKITNLFKFINNQVETRRKKFVAYNGNYADYIEKSKETVPSLVFIINQADIFLELYSEYMERLSELTRDANKYGIYFILTTSNVNGIKSKISQNIKTLISLQLNDTNDYKTILGNTNGVLPSKIFGRGLIKLDRVVEFQSAYCYDKETMYQEIQKQCLDTFIKFKVKAIPIPVLPEIVKLDDVLKEPVSITNIPVGLTKKNLSSASINLEEHVAYLIGTRSYDNILGFLDMLLRVLNRSTTFSTFVFDTRYVYEQNIFDNITYLTSNYKPVIEQLNDYTEKIDDILVKNNSNKRAIKNVKHVVCVIFGVEKFIKSLESEQKKQFENIIAKAKDNYKVHFIYIDVPGNYKKIEFEPWYKDAVDASCGVWIGDGFGEQFAIKATTVEKSYYESIGNKFGYMVKTGGVELMKNIEKE